MDKCTICTDIYETHNRPMVLNCGHTFCNCCIKEIQKTGDKCPVCRTAITMTVCNFAIMDALNLKKTKFKMTPLVEKFYYCNDYLANEIDNLDTKTTTNIIKYIMKNDPNYLKKEYNKYSYSVKSETVSYNITKCSVPLFEILLVNEKFNDLLLELMDLYEKYYSDYDDKLLNYAIDFHNNNLVKKLLDIDRYNDVQTFPLHNAYYEGNLEMCSYIIDNYPKYNVKNHCDTYPFHSCFESSFMDAEDIVDHIIKHYKDKLNTFDCGGAGIIISMLLSDKYSVGALIKLIDAGVDCRKCDKYGNNILHVLFDEFGTDQEEEYQEIIKYLFEKHEYLINMKNEDGDTPIVSYVCYNDELPECDIEQYENKIDFEFVDDNSDNLLMMAIDSENWNIVEWLLKQNINLNHQNKDGETVLMKACARNHPDPMLLVKEKTDLNLQDKDGNTALMHIMENLNQRSGYCGYVARSNIITSLIDRGADHKIKNKNNITALHIACKNIDNIPSTDIIKYLALLAYKDG